MSDKKILFKFKGEKSWQMQLPGIEILETYEDESVRIKAKSIVDNIAIIEVDNYLIKRADDKFFFSTLQKCITGDTIFYQPLFFEQNSPDNPDKIGDVIILLRKNPHTHRWMIQIDQEDLFETEFITRRVWRTLRSFLDNIIQSVGNRVVNHIGWIYSNPRRIGGKPIAVHYVTAGWAPQEEVINKMMDVFQYVQTTDAIGLAVFLKSLTHMSDKTAKEILGQLRNPPEDQG